MSYHSELDAAQRPSDDALAAAELRGARAALTRLAEYRNAQGRASLWIDVWRDREYPAPRVRAVYSATAGMFRAEWDRDDTVRITVSGHVVWVARDAIRELYALDQRADAEGFVSADDVASRGEASLDGTEEGLGAAAVDGAALASDRQEPSGSAPTPARCDCRRHERQVCDTCQGPDGEDAPAPAEAGSAPPPTREWWLCVEPSGEPYVERTLREAKKLQARDDELVHVREVRPLTAAQVEALGKTIGDAITIHRDDFVLEARAALAHLGIPYEEA